VPHVRCATCRRPLVPRLVATGCPSCGDIGEIDWSPPTIDGDDLPPFLAWAPLGTDPVTLGEGRTPLVPVARWGDRFGLSHARAKLEYISPTGSFKDRGTAAVVTHARAIGAGSLSEDSSGNAGASLAAYGARAGIPVRVYVPESASGVKVAQISAVGAEVIRVPGSRRGVTEAAIAHARDTGGYYAGHNANPYFTLGMASLAFELAPDPPDHLVMPVGGGSLFVGVALAFAAMGGLRRVTRLHAVQPAGCAPIVAAYERGEPVVAPIDRHATIASGAEIETPPRGRQILDVLALSGGRAIAVTDAELLAHREALAHAEGIDVEPTAALALAGAARLRARGVLVDDESVVIVLTGAGYKVAS